MSVNMDTNNIFGKKEDKKKASAEAKNQVDNVAVSNLLRRMRILEERFINLQKKSQVTEKNMIETNKSDSTGIKELNKDMSEVKKQIKVMNEKIDRIITELKNKANQNEFLVYQKYLELWRPVNFVSRKEVQRMIDEKNTKSLKTKK
jgi:hypothetical protein